MSLTPDVPRMESSTDAMSEGNDLEGRIAEILADPMVAPAEKRATLERLRDEAGEAATDQDAYAPLELQLRHALALLADGGHDYADLSTKGEGKA